MTIQYPNQPDLITSLFGSSGDTIFLVILLFGVAYIFYLFEKGKIRGIG